MNNEEQLKELQEKLEKMSPEERQTFMREQCVFCQIIDGKVPGKKVYEDDLCIALLDINPATKGHILLLPKEHVSIAPQVPQDIMLHLGKMAKKLSHACLRGLQAKGTNLFMANGPAAGQVANHFIIHIIPRYEDDGIDTLSLPETDVDEKELENLSTQMREFIEKLKAQAQAPKEEKKEPQKEEKKEEAKPKESEEKEEAPPAPEPPKEEEKKEEKEEQQEDGEDKGANLDDIARLFG